MESHNRKFTPHLFSLPFSLVGWLILLCNTCNIFFLLKRQSYIKICLFLTSIRYNIVISEIVSALWEAPWQEKEQYFLLCIKAAILSVRSLRSLHPGMCLVDDSSSSSKSLLYVTFRHKRSFK